MIDNNKTENSYIAPTVYRPKNGVSSYRYYATVSAALRQLLLLNKLEKGKPAISAGTIAFKTPAATTLGINVDFFMWTASQGVLPVTYEQIRKALPTTKARYPFFFRFTKTDGKGPYYAVFDKNLLGLAADVATGLTPAKVAALDEYNRQLQIAKANFNSYSEYIGKLQSKRMSTAEFASYQAAVDKRAKFEAALRDLSNKGEFDIVFKKDNAVTGIGIVPLVIIAIIVVTGAVAAYAVHVIISSNERIKTTNASFNFQKFLADQNLQIQKDVKAGTITATQGQVLTQQNNQSAATAQQVVTDVVKAGTDAGKQGFLDQITNLLKWGLVGFAAVKIIPPLLNKKNV